MNRILLRITALARGSRRSDGPRTPVRTTAESGAPRSKVARRERTTGAVRRASLGVAGLAIALTAAYASAVAAGSLLAGPADNPLAKRAGTYAPGLGVDPATKLTKTLNKSLGQPGPDPARKVGKHEQLIAAAKRPAKGIEVFRRPGARDPYEKVNRRKGIGGPLVFAVVRARDNWLKVRLPVRPNGSVGWIRRDATTLSVTDWAVKIDLSDHVVSVRRRGEQRFEWDIGIGQPETPTPPGEYYITELIKPKRSSLSLYGAYVFVLSGFSDKVTSFAGGNGELGLHGTDNPSGLGGDVSLGCIRMRNAAITELTQRLPLGTPVEIVE